MSEESIERMWEECRDGELSGARRHAFDESMLDDAKQRSLWGAESRWLQELKSARSEDDAAGEMFRGRVLERWDQQLRRRQRIRRFWRKLPLAAVGATAAALVALITWTGQAPQSLPAPIDVTSSARDPVTILVHDMAEQFQTQPADFVAAVRDTGQMFTVEHALLMFGVPGEQEHSQWNVQYKR
jgi:hypothetical protein